MDREQVRRSITSNGVTKTIQDLVLRAVNRAIVLKVLKGIKIEKVNPDFLQCNERYRCQFLDPAALRDFSRNKDYELSTRFLDMAFEKGDRCYAILDGSRLAAYGWYSCRPTTVDVPGLLLHFNPQYVYMYKGFTHNDYRGQRLHAVGMTRALAAYLERGCKGIVSYVEWNNFASLKSCYRMGYEDFGVAYALGFGTRYLLRSSSGCKEYAFRLEREPARQNWQLPEAGKQRGSQTRA